MKKLIVAATLAAGMSTNVYADAIGLYVGGSVWQQTSEGVFGESSQQVNFNLADQTQNSFYVAVEHPLPFIPNAKIAKSTIATQGQVTLSSSFEFDGEVFDASSQAMTDFDVSFVDYTIYYELFDNDLMSFDFGVTVRDFDGDVTVSGEVEGNSATGTIATTEMIPMLYARTNIGLPFTGFNVFAEGNLLSIDDHTLFDYQLGVSYELVDNMAIDINLTLGYRSLKLELEDLDNLYSDIEFDGVFAGVVLHF